MGRRVGSSLICSSDGLVKAIRVRWINVVIASNSVPPAHLRVSSGPKVLHSSHWAGHPSQRHSCASEALSLGNTGETLGPVCVWCSIGHGQ